MTKRVYNFGPGPAMLPTPVLERAREELLDLGGTGMSAMEHAHRGEAFTAIAAQTEADLRGLLAIPDDYRVLFMQGGATLQFAAVPLNLAPEGATVDHLVTGHWSEKAAAEARRHNRVNVAADGGPEYRAVPDPAQWNLTEDAAYLAYAANETIHGVEFPYVPESGGVPLVADVSSTILSRPLDVSRFGVIYAGAQKNLGPAGLAVVIVGDDLIGKARPGIPGLLDYAAVAASDSMLNTPPTFTWYLVGLVLAWVKEEGGLAEMAERNRRKKDLLYEAIDASELYHNPVDPAFRSWTNVPFTLTDPDLEPEFLERAEAAGLANLRGHRAVGGMRASLYNAMPEEGVAALVEFMADFEKQARTRR